MAKQTLSALQILKESIRHFRNDDGFTLAAALSFYAILSLIPLTMILVSILGHLLGHSEAVLESIIQLISESIPQLSPSFLKSLSSLIQRKLTGGWVGVTALFLVASVLFSNLEKVLDKIFDNPKKRNFFHSKLLSVLFIFLISILLFLPGVLKNANSLFSLLQIPFSMERVTQGSFFFFLVGWASFIIVLAVVPKQEVSFRLNFLGGFVFALLLIGVKEIFHWYTQLSFERFHLVYGSLTALILIILWIFYFMNLFIFCAELVGVLQKEK